MDASFGWARAPLSVDVEHVLESLEAAAPVRLVATPRAALVTCAVDDDLRRAVDHPEHRPFDHLPVRDGEVIVGLLPRARLARDGIEPGTSVERAMVKLDERRLIAGDAALLTYLVEADEHPTRLVVDGARVTGIVTLADLQKLPVRPVLFLLITHIELLITAVLRHRAADIGAYLDVLNPQRRDRIKAKWTELEQANMAADMLHAMDFCDKRTVLLETVPLDRSRNQAKRDLERIERLRNSVAHAGAYALTEARTRRTVQVVKVAREWIDRLERLRHDPDDTGPQHDEV